MIFTSRRTGSGSAEYAAAARRMEELARGMEGFLGFESARGADGAGISISYWSDAGSIARWKAHAEHREAQSRGKSEWYDQYTVRVAKVEREYSGG